MKNHKTAPVAYFGGKGHLKKKLLPLIPYTKLYAEPFGGAGSILFARNPSPVEFYNDLNQHLVELFRVLQNPEKNQQLKYKIKSTLYSRSEFNKAREILAKPTDNPIEIAWAFYVAQNQGFSGRGVKSSWGSALTSSNRGMASTTSRWFTRINHFETWLDRLKKVQIECRDGIELIKHLDEPYATIYVDPPYPKDTRKSGKYLHEITDEQHEELVATLCKFKGNAIISTYPSPIYKSLERAKYQKIEVKTSCSAAGRTRSSGLQGIGNATHRVPRTEIIYRRIQT